jgi:hypothetical protein
MTTLSEVFCLFFQLSSLLFSLARGPMWVKINSHGSFWPSIKLICKVIHSSPR